jgi:hypothetical protein
MDKKTVLTERMRWEKVVLEKMHDWNINSELHNPILICIEHLFPLMVVGVIGFIIGLNKSQK